MQNTTSRPRRLSLVQPSGHLTLGNYLGALRPMAAEQHRFTCFFGVADLHAMTVAHDPDQLRGTTLEVAGVMVAAGIDPDHATLFLQSQVPAHTELSYLLECTAHMGELGRMIQFKEKGRGRPGTRVSLFTYPALMAADILLYRASEVPVGNDQRQHVELTRDLALRFNRTYGEVFTVPRITTPPTGARIMNLQDPTAKMSKSAGLAAGNIYLLDDPATVRRKIARAVTDGETGADAVRHDPSAKPGVSNLLEIIAGCEGGTPDTAAAGLTTYGGLKERATEAVLSVLGPVQQRYAEIAAEPDLLRKVYADGAAHCREQTGTVLAAARTAVGLVS